MIEGLTINEDIGVCRSIRQDIVNCLKVHILLFGKCEPFGSSGDMYTRKMIIDKFNSTSRSKSARFSSAFF